MVRLANENPESTRIRARAGIAPTCLPNRACGGSALVQIRPTPQGHALGHSASGADLDGGEERRARACARRSKLNRIMTDCGSDSEVGSHRQSLLVAAKRLDCMFLAMRQIGTKDLVTNWEPGSRLESRR